MKLAILLLAVSLAGCTGAQIEAGAPNITVPPAVVHQAPFPAMTGEQVEAQIKANAEYPALKEWWRRFVQAWAASRN